MKKFLTLILSLLLIAALAFAAGCKKAEEPSKAPAPAPAPEPEQKPAEAPAPVPVPEKKPSETLAPVPEKKATEAPAPLPKKKPAETAVSKQKAAESPVARLKPAEEPAPVLASAPSFAIPDVNNRKVTLADYKGKVIMLEFTASWCPPCRISAKDVQTIYEKYKGKGFVVLGIFVDMGANAASLVDSFVKKFNITYPALIDDGSVNKQYGVSVNAIPTKFIIDKQGKIRKTYIGGKFDIDALSKEIEGLL